MEFPKWQELKDMSRQELIEEYDRLMERVGKYDASPNFIVQEVARRDTDEYTRQIRNLTWAIAIMTAVITVATILNWVLQFAGS